jgi:iron complex outermembrane receptor protein
MRIPLVVMMAIAAGTTSVSAQALRLSGRVTDSAGDPLGGVRVEERGTLNGTVTRADGTYELRYSSANAVIVFAQLGYRRQEFSVRNMANLDVVMEVAVHVIEGMEVVGTRRADRSAVETPVAVDVIDVPALIQSVGQLEVNQLLHYVAPSFNANRQSGADGSDHIDPATLRGLGPDQTLVLINGKRQHQSSLINIFGSRGRGNTGTDLNAIPLAAIDRIEILRDGASAQYGSDAIAGVINIVLKQSVDEFSGSVAGGFNNAKPPSEFAGPTRPVRQSHADRLAGHRRRLRRTTDHGRIGHLPAPGERECHCWRTQHLQPLSHTAGHRDRDGWSVGCCPDGVLRRLLLRSSELQALIR